MHFLKHEVALDVERLVLCGWECLSLTCDGWGGVAMSLSGAGNVYDRQAH